jgi:hypothetical protein
MSSPSSNTRTSHEEDDNTFEIGKPASNSLEDLMPPVPSLVGASPPLSPKRPPVKSRSLGEIRKFAKKFHVTLQDTVEVSYFSCSYC